MTIAVVVLAGAVVYLLWAGARSTERLVALHAQHIDSLQEFQRVDKERWERAQHALLDRFQAERKDWERERGTLLNRIKPETAQYIPGDEPTETPPPLAFDDDDAYWADRETREELAERLMAQEVSNGSDG